LLALMSSFFNLSQIISGSTGPIFTIFSPNERYLREFSRSGPHFPTPQGTLPRQPILGKICEITFIQHAGILQRIRISQFHFIGDKGHNFCYILCNFDKVWFTNTKDHAGIFCTFWDETAKIDISYQISQRVVDRTSPTFQHWSLAVRVVQRPVTYRLSPCRLNSCPTITSTSSTLSVIGVGL